MCTKYPYVAMISDFAKIGIIKVQFEVLIPKFVKNICWIANEVQYIRRIKKKEGPKPSF